MRLSKLIVGVGILLTQSAFAHGPQPLSLQGAPLPPVPGLVDGADPIVVDKEAAKALGKALFWDVNVGSDGMACGSCHFHAGADNRVTNQLNPGQKSIHASGQEFGGTLAASLGNTKTGAAAEPNYTMRTGDFPLRQYSNPLSKTGSSVVTYSTDDVMASAGTFSGTFKNTSKFTGVNDNCDRSVDPIYHVNSVGTRRVEPRNAPTVFNAVFNDRNFWDGRANNVFNGSSIWGDRDVNAGVWEKVNSRTVQKAPLHLINSSLASQALAPGLSDAEMSCQHRSWADIGRKLLLRQPLQAQKVHNEDSVLGVYSLSTAGNLKPGLNTTYQTLIKKAFNPKYWSFIGTAGGKFGSPATGTPYNQLEANFSMFFGLALQIYQETLVSDQAPIDITNRDVNNIATWDNLGYDQAKIDRLKLGESTFVNNHCQMCHSGPVTTLAAITTNAMLLTPTLDPETNEIKKYGSPNHLIEYGPLALGGSNLPGGAHDAGLNTHGNVITRDVTRNGVGVVFNKLMDMGFVNTGVGDPDADPGVNGLDDFGHPLSFTKQYLEYLQDHDDSVVDSVVRSQWSCDFLLSIADNELVGGDLFVTADGIIPDGSKEGVLRNTDCLRGETAAFLPSVDAAVASLNTTKMGYATKAAFKVPSLRNVELTGPYMHNGSMATLQQVIEFYARKGNFENDDKQQSVSQINLSSLAATASRAALVEFLKTFTDPRVRYERAPFDHPEISVPNGHVVNNGDIVSGNSINGALAQDIMLTVPAVGANGRDTPLQPFDAGLQP